MSPLPATAVLARVPAGYTAEIWVARRPYIATVAKTADGVTLTLEPHPSLWCDIIDEAPRSPMDAG